MGSKKGKGHILSIGMMLTISSIIGLVVGKVNSYQIAYFIYDLILLTIGAIILSLGIYIKIKSNKEDEGTG